MPQGDVTNDAMIVHGLTLSYFTGKLEAYLRVKGIPFRFAEMGMRSFRRAARATGVAQMPQIEMPDGTWLSDTTRIIRHFEAAGAGPSMSPADPATRFASLLLEDYGDEWLWRPALYYRWAFGDDMKLMSAQIARGMMRDLKLPFLLKRRFILARQRRVYLGGDGVTRETAPQIEALYLQTLDAMEAILSRRPYLMGERPVEADFGFFASMFRHFSSDPTPAAIMRARAPHVLAWVARLWAARPGDIEAAELPAAIPDDLAPLLARASSDYLPYLAANEAALAREEPKVRYVQDGTNWTVPVSPYRAHCLAMLRAEYSALDASARATVDMMLGSGSHILADKTSRELQDIAAPLPASRPVDRHWRGRAGRRSS